MQEWDKNYEFFDKIPTIKNQSYEAIALLPISAKLAGEYGLIEITLVMTAH